MYMFASPAALLRCAFILGLVVVMPGCAKNDTEPAPSVSDAGPEKDANPGPVEAPKAASSKQRVADPQASAQDLQAQVAASNAFAIDLYQQIRGSGDNLFASPHSISTALAMLYAGARGETERQIKGALHFELPQATLHPVLNKLDLMLAQHSAGDDAPELAIANSVWGRPDGTYLPEYLDLLALSYGAGVQLADFGGDPEGARRLINAWVADRTHDRIDELLREGDISPYTALVLINAIYFKGAWQEPFEEVATRPHDFDADGKTVTVQMMAGLKRQARYAQGEGYQAVALPFEGGSLSMLVLVPDAGTFRAFQQALSAATFQNALGRLAAQDVYLELPRFSFRSRPKLKPALQALGMVDAFEPTQANFEGICGVAGGNAGLVVSDVLHEAFVEVGEQGAEAAAATGVVMADGGVAAGPPPPPPVQLTVDRPFLFAIQDDVTGAMLFLGHVVDPTR